MDGSIVGGDVLAGAVLLGRDSASRPAIHPLTVAISRAVSCGSLAGGMCLSSAGLRFRRFTSVLARASPGTIAGPDLPPSSNAASESTRSLPFCLSGPWHFTQCAENTALALGLLGAPGVAGVPGEAVAGDVARGAVGGDAAADGGGDALRAVAEEPGLGEAPGGVIDVGVLAEAEPASACSSRLLASAGTSKSRTSSASLA